MNRCTMTGVALAAALAALAPVGAGEVVHVVRPGESASAIAKQYFGDYDLAALVLRYNGRTDSVIHAGESLRVPFCDEHRVRAGETWSELTRRYVGRSDGWRVVAELNGMPPSRALRVGDRLVFPVVIATRLGRGESLAGIAQRTWGDPKRAALLQEWNRIDDPRRLSVGTAIEIPVVQLRRVHRAETASRPPEKQVEVEPAPAPAPAAPQRDEPKPPRFGAELEDARRALREARFEEAARGLESLRGSLGASGAEAERSELWRMLLVAYVALDRPVDICAAYRALEQVEGEVVFDADLVSPRVRDAAVRCSPPSVLP